MKIIIGSVLAVGVVTIAGVLWANEAQPAEQLVWRAGTARGKITPRRTVLGWPALPAGAQPAEGTLHDLWVKVLALEDGRQQKVIIITTDLVGYPKKVADTVCNQIARQCGLRRSQYIVTCSHTHSGPVLAGS